MARNYVQVTVRNRNSMVAKWFKKGSVAAQDNVAVTVVVV